MPRPLTRAQALQNNAFLRVLRHSGNIRLAAREIGMSYGTVQHRRSRHPAFAQRIDAALAFAQARLSKMGLRGPVGAKAAPTRDEPVPSNGSSQGLPAGRAQIVSQSASLSACDPRRTRGGEPVVVRRNDGKLQMRRAQPGKLTQQCEQAFLAALSATANVALSAAAAGAAEAAFYRRRRNNPGFAREMRLALQMGYERLEMALLESFDPMSHSDDAWRHNEPPPIPSMTPAQALQLLYLHQKEARLIAEPAAARRRRGEPPEAHRMRMILMHEAMEERAREEFRTAEAERRARGEQTYVDWEAEGITLPDLSQVTGWSKAKPNGAGVHDPDVALFGGWRLKDLEKRRGS